MDRLEFMKNPAEASADGKSGGGGWDSRSFFDEAQQILQPGQRDPLGRE